MRETTRFKLVAALGAAVSYALLVYVFVWVLRDQEAFPFVAGLILLPAAIGTFTTVLTDPYAQNTYRRNLWHTTIVIGSAVLLAAIFFTEGLICILMAAPFFIGGAMFSVWLTRMVLRHYVPEGKDQTILRSVAFIVPLLMLPIDGMLDNPTELASVMSEFIIEAPADVIWEHTVEISHIAAEERIWSTSHNLIRVPLPIDARMEGVGVGAVRHLRWTQGVTFREVITEWEDGRKIAWDFAFDEGSIPPAVEAHIDVKSDYLDLSGGEYELEVIDANTTLLRLTTYYEMTTPFNAYCRWWGDLFLNDFHNGVLTVIKERSEAAGESPTLRGLH